MPAKSKHSFKPKKPPQLSKIPAVELSSQPAIPSVEPLSFAVIPVNEILDPDIEARAGYAEGPLRELMDSILAVGLIEPLVVSRQGELYRLHAGKRRLMCARAIGMTEVPCVIRAEDGISPRAITAHENAFRQDLNAAEESLYFWELLEKDCNGDTVTLAGLLKRDLTFVERRLKLRTGDSEVFKAVMSGAIGATIAGELNMVNDSSRRAMYLEAACKGGATYAMVHDWRLKGNIMDAMQEHTPGALVETPAAAAPVRNELVCALCTSEEDAYEMEIMYVHRSCRRMLERNRGTEDTARSGAPLNAAPLFTQ
jgi:ParB/RepB/Spo0J family partition protein